MPNQQNNNNFGQIHWHIIARLYIPFALGYLISFLYRVVNGVLGKILSTEFDLTKADLGFMTASYFLTFMVAQIPMGIILDKWGARKTESFMMIFAILGAVIFAIAENSWHLILGRGLIGLGVSVGLMAAFKAYSEYFEPKKLPMINNMQMLAGGVGAMLGTAPVEALLQYTDWRGIFVILAVATAIIALMIFFIPPKIQEKHQHPPESFTKALHAYWVIYSDKKYWLLTPPTMVSQACQVSVVFLWGGLYLTNIAHYSLHESAFYLSVAAFFMLVSFLVFGFGSVILPKRGIPTERLVLWGQYLVVLGFILVIFLPERLSYWGMFLVVGSMGSGILTYGLLSIAYPKNLTGRVNSALNLCSFTTAFFLQWIIGVIIDWAISMGFADKMAYQLGFALPLGLMIFTILIQKILHIRHAKNG